MTYNITAYSTALFSTWINIEELNLLFDAGDGVCSGLLQKSRKIKHVFISHPDRDHLTGLPQFLQLNSREGWPKIYYPKDSGSFPALNKFLQEFDPHISSSEWMPVQHKSRVEIKKDVMVEAIRNEHVNSPAAIDKSLSYRVYEIKRKLKAEFQSKTEKEIQTIVSVHGRDTLTEIIEKNIISFSGDTPVDDYSKWDGSETLIHESTFLRNENDSQVESRGNKHSRVDEVLKMAAEIRVNNLILTHFSSRYSREEIDRTARMLIKEYGINIPVYLVYPGEIKRDILRTSPINE